MIAVIDNYDSFTWNLVQYLWELGAEVKVFRNDQISLATLRGLRPSHLVVSPGPCTPSEAGISLEAITQVKAPILGVCLGHQAIGQAFGGKVVRAGQVMHGKTSHIRHDEKGVFRNIPNEFVATRYHSLVVQEGSLPEDLQVTARSEDGEIMGLRHRSLPVEGVQFHPEALLTEHGHKMLQNFIEGKRP
ncbi:MAG TPA: aminodeoxychorismate/anthranilate synthase component II [Burkholderiales bacterium]|nr:aminodeoxychorismate/anthranilate synthase component II [Burkholderiales bacterium]